MFDEFRPTRAEIFLDNIAYNFNEIKKMAGSNVKLMGVVKANSYGHGSIEVANTLIKNGVEYLAVATVEEGIELRNSGILTPILVFGYTPLNFAKVLISYNITQTVFELSYAEELSKIALKENKRALIHIKLDTGMGRLGYTNTNKAVNDIINMSKLQGIIIEGIYSHFSTSDEKDKAYSIKQFTQFKNVVNAIEMENIHIPIKHIANSGAILDLKETYLDMIRPGIILYGSYPSKDVKKIINIKPTMNFKTKIVYIKDMPKGQAISYGRTFITKRPSKIATLPVGYADGLNRLLSNNHNVLVKNNFAPIVGRICMDQCMIDVTDIKGVNVGDDVVLFGEQGDKNIKVEEVADKLNTIPYEVYCSISRRVPRIYISNGKIIGVKNYLE
ncbi:MAG: alanine racemase [Thermoanaerobacteraceae bacterium]